MPMPVHPSSSTRRARWAAWPGTPMPGVHISTSLIVVLPSGGSLPGELRRSALGHRRDALAPVRRRRQAILLGTLAGERSADLLREVAAHGLADGPHGEGCRPGDVVGESHRLLSELGQVDEAVGDTEAVRLLAP